MTRLRLIFAVALCPLALSVEALAQEQLDWTIDALNDNGWAEYDPATHIARGTNGVRFRSGLAVGTAESVTMNIENGEVVADGAVRIQRDNQIWTSEHVGFNSKTLEMEARQF